MGLKFGALVPIARTKIPNIKTTPPKPKPETPDTNVYLTNSLTFQKHVVHNDVKHYFSGFRGYFNLNFAIHVQTTILLENGLILGNNDLKEINP